jgi:hypothetical protein
MLVTCISQGKSVNRAGVEAVLATREARQDNNTMPALGRCSLGG